MWTRDRLWTDKTSFSYFKHCFGQLECILISRSLCKLVFRWIFDLRNSDTWIKIVWLNTCLVGSEFRDSI